MMADLTPLERLWRLEHELEGSIHQSGATDGERNCVSIARGYLELSRDHAEPLNLIRVEQLLAHGADAIGSVKFRRAFLIRLRSITGWLRVAA